MYDVVISIISHGQQELVNRLILSFNKHLVLDGVKLKIVVVENLLPHISLVQSQFDIDMLINLRVKGFGPNHNAVFERYSPRLFFIVNPDILLDSEFSVGALFRRFKDENFDIASPFVFGPTGVLEDFRRITPTPFALIRRKLGFASISENFTWLAGMFLIVSGASFFKLRGFDPKYFMYVEDCDLCLRARSLSLDIVVLEDFRVIHEAQRTSRKNFRYLFWHLRSLFILWFSLR